MKKVCPSGKVDFQIHGNHPGGEILIGDDSGKLNHVKLFDRSQQLFEELERTKISNNLAQIYEGKTISYVVGINVNKDSNYKSKLSPFKAFAIDSKGGVTSMFYTANTKTGTGDIIIDGGFSKLFYELKEEGTYRYIQNIIGWTARPELHIRVDKKKPWEWRPKAINYTISNISSPNNSSMINDLKKSAEIAELFGNVSVILEEVKKLGGITSGVLGFSIMWNDLGGHDKNDLDAHCIEPGDFEIMYSNKKNENTLGNLDVDITSPEPGEKAVENITWPELNRMKEGTYRFFVHQFSHRDGHQSGFRAVIQYEDIKYYYDYRQELPNKSSVDVAYVELHNGSFSIRHCLPHYQFYS